MMVLKSTTIHIDQQLYDELKMKVFSRKMMDPQMSMSRMIALALREYFDKDGR